MYRKDFVDGSFHVVEFDKYGELNRMYDKDGKEIASGESDKSDWEYGKSEFINELLQSGYRKL